MSRRSARCVALTMLVGLAAACSDGGSSSGSGAPGGSDPSASLPAPTSGDPVAGGVCNQADARTDIGGSEYICMLKTGKTLVWTAADSSGGDNNGGNNGGDGASGSHVSDDIPKTIQSWGFDLQPYDPATGMAGVMKIAGARTPPPDPHNQMDTRYLFIDYGKGDSGTTDLQMAFFLPLGTPVLAMATGVVCDVPKLYSNDYSVRIAPTGVNCEGPGRAWVLFETEHVLNPLVKVGDSVVAGQHVATVSDYRNDWRPLGYGTVEIGVFFNKGGDGAPWHACPARFLDPTKAEELTAALASIHAAWEAEAGDTSLYDEAAQTILGCATLDDIQG